MKYALLGDIHSSVGDLEAVLSHIQKLPYATTVIGLGDLFECRIGKSQLATLSGPLPIEEVQENPDGFEALLTFPSIYGNQEVRIMQASQTNAYEWLPETLHIQNATLIHGHQFKWNWTPCRPYYEQWQQDPLLFFGHSHYSLLFIDSKRHNFEFGKPIPIQKKHYGINVGSVIANREWVLYDTDLQTITFMKTI